MPDKDSNARPIRPDPEADDVKRAREAYYRTANDPPADARPIDGGTGPLTHSTGGAKDHERRGEGEAPPRGPAPTRAPETGDRPVTGPRDIGPETGRGDRW